MEPQTRIVFMGTPEFAVPSLQALVEAGPRHDWQVVAVVTQPDRRAGRGKKLVVSPVKAYADDHGLPVLQPARLRKRPEAVAELAALDADLFVVAAYGLILPKDVLDLPRFGCINVHASLLPAYRGASPIAAAILDGLEETGVTLMLMDEGMDTGPSLRQVKQSILPNDTTYTLAHRLAEQGAHALVEFLPDWLAGNVAPIDQAELPGELSVCHMIKKEDGHIDWTRPARYIERMTRAYAPWPSAFTTWRGENFKIIRAGVRDGQGSPGVVGAMDGGVTVGTGDGLLVLHEVQPAGKRPMGIGSFLNGAPEFVGARLDNGK
jgi:methionyl-tRNA formyltransferase